MKNELSSNLKLGFFYTAIGKYGMMIIQIVVNAILSRLLSPSDYGIVAITTVFITFFQLLADMGIGPAIIQNKTLTNDDIGEIYWFSIILSLFFTILFGLSGIVFVSIYNDEIYYKLNALLSLSVLFYSLLIVPNAILLKKKDFKAINLFKIIAAIIGGGISMLLALDGWGVFSLAINNIIIAVISFVLIAKRSQVKIKLPNNFNSLKKIWTFSKNQFGFNFINYFSRNSDNILIGKFISTEALGNYNKAYQLLMYPNTIFSGIITPVLQPVLSDYESDVKTIKKIYLDIVHILALFGMPLSIFFSLSSRQVIFFMFGNQWEDAILPFSILALTVWIQMLVSSTGAIFQARNKTNYLMFGGLVSAFILVFSIVLGVSLKSIIYVSLFLTFGFVVNLIFSFWLLMTKALSSNLLEFFSHLIRPTVISFFVGIGLLLYGNFINPQNIFMDLLFRGIIFLVICVTLGKILGEDKIIKRIIFVK